MPTLPICSVVIAVSGDDRIYRLIDSLLDQSLNGELIEIIVVENGSCEFGDLAARNERITYIHIPTANMATARNAGLQIARGRYLLTTDADVVVSREWAERISEALRTGEAAAVGGPIAKMEGGTWVQRYAPTIVNGQSTLSYLPALPLPYVAGANAGYVIDAVREVGGFDERFRSGSDVDLCYRLGLAGYKVSLADHATVVHEDRASVGAHFHRFRNYAVYQVLLFAAYRSVSGRRLVINVYPIRRFLAGLLALPFALASLVAGHPGPSLRALLQLVEAAGVWWGDLQGSVRFRQFYI